MAKRLPKLGPFGSVVACSLFVLLATDAMGRSAERGETGWPIYHGDAGLRGATETELPAELTLLWRFKAGSEVAHTPVAGGGRIYFPDETGAVYAIDLDGRRVWSRIITARGERDGAPKPERFRASALYIDGAVVVGSRNGRLYSLDAGAGEIRWRYVVGASIQGSPNWIAGSRGKGIAVIVVSQPEGVVHRVDFATGRRIWRSVETNRCDGSAAVDAGRIVFGNCDAALHAFSARTGEKIRSIQLRPEGQVFAGVAVDGNLVFAGDRTGRMYCADLAANEILWVNEDSSGDISSTPAVAGDRVVFASDDGGVYAVDRDTGKRLWRFETDGRPKSPVIARDKVIVSSDGVLFLLDLSDGKRLWSRQVSDEITSPAVVGGAVLVGTDEGFVEAFGGAEAAGEGERRDR